jgi:integrase/recombinase XerD
MGMTASLVTAWLLSAGSRHTVRAYRSDLVQYADWLANHDTEPLTATRHHLDTYVRELVTLTAPATVARKLAAISSFYGYAVDEGWRETNPAARVRRPDADPDYSPTQGLDSPEARALIRVAVADGPRSEAIIRLLLETGMRVSELAGARIEERGTDRGHRYVTVTRKGGRRQRLVLAPSAAHAVDVVTAGRARGPVIVTSSGKPMATSELYRAVRRLAGKAGIAKHITPHSLRHTYATLALDSGVPLTDVQTDMGHRDPRTTRRYDRARQRLDRSGAYRVAAAIDGGEAARRRG